MRQVIKISSVLTLICLICAFSLALVYDAANEKIIANQKKAIQESIDKLAPEATNKEKVDGQNNLWKLYKNKSITGYAFIAAGNGYGGEIKIMVVTGPDFEVVEGIEIIESNETPGLGSRISEKSFKTQFKNLEARKPIKCSKEKNGDSNQIQAITGATISSRSVVEIINKKLSELRKKNK